jgi:ubiquinone/menaquinone biosynthesis C-methylase UbiE
MSGRRVLMTVVGLVLAGSAVLAATPLGRDLLFHAMPLRWTGEGERLAQVLRIAPGASVADVGAGNGALIVELARAAGPTGRAYASERTAEKRAAITRRAQGAGVAVSVVEAGDLTTNLPDECCDAITMRMVMHHITDRQEFARQLRRALRAGGRIGIIDFAPGALPHLADDHGVSIEQVVSAFAAAGFEIDARVDDWGGRSFLLVFRRR